MAVHLVRRRLAFTRERIFDLVLDVERYPRFLPGWLAARVRDRSHGSYRTDQVVQLRLIRQHFSSHTSFVRPERIEVRTDPGAIVRRFDLRWEFLPCGGDACEVALACQLDLAVGPLTRMADTLARDLIESLVHSFQHEAARLFGPGHAGDYAAGPVTGRATGHAADHATAHRGHTGHAAVPPTWHRPVPSPIPPGGTRQAT